MTIIPFPQRRAADELAEVIELSARSGALVRPERAPLAEPDELAPLATPHRIPQTENTTSLPQGSRARGAVSVFGFVLVWLVTAAAELVGPALITVLDPDVCHARRGRPHRDRQPLAAPPWWCPDWARGWWRSGQIMGRITQWLARHRTSAGHLVSYAVLAAVAGRSDARWTAAYGTVAVVGTVLVHGYRRGTSRTAVDVSALHSRAERRRARRLGRRQSARWEQTARKVKIVGTRVLAITLDEWSMTMDLKTGHEHGADEIRKIARHLERSLGMRLNSARVEPIGDRSDRVRVRFMLTDPLAAAMAPPVPDGSSNLVSIGRFETGPRVVIDVLAHLLIAGQTGSGKSNLIQVIIRYLIHLPWVAVIGVDLKPGAPELGRWRGRIAGLARTPAQTMAVLTALCADLESRGEIMDSRGWRKWRPTAAEPHIMVIIDEAQGVMALPGGAALLVKVAALLRAYGGTLILATQYPTKGSIPPPVKEQMPQSIGLRVKTATATAAIFGPDAADRWRAHELTGHAFLIEAAALGRYDVPTPATGWLMDDDDLDREVVRAPDPVRVDAATCPALAAVLAGTPGPAAGTDPVQDPGAADVAPGPVGNAERVAAMLQGDWTHADEIAATLEITRRTVDTHAAALVAAGRAEKGRGRRKAYYRRPEGNDHDQT
jgi:hypothetical protein